MHWKFCQSILFLTTDPVRSCDGASISRVHISLYYRAFTEDSRLKIWTNFFHELEEDGKNIMFVPVKTVIRAIGPEFASLERDRRKIPNGEWASFFPRFIDGEGWEMSDWFLCDTVLQTAAALADFDSETSEGG